MSLQSPLFTISYQESQKVAAPDLRGALADALEKVKGFGLNAANSLGDAAGKAKDVAVGAAGKARDAIGDAGGAIGGAAGKARDAIGGAAGKARDVIGGAAGKARDTIGDATGKATRATTDFLENYQGELLAGLTGAGVAGGAYGLTASQRPHETEEEFRHRRNMGILRTALMGGGLVGAARPALQWFSGSGGENRWSPIEAKHPLTGGPMFDDVGNRMIELRGLPGWVEKLTGGSPVVSPGGPGAPLTVPTTLLPGTPNEIPSGTIINKGPNFIDDALSDYPQYAGAVGGGYLGQHLGGIQSSRIAKSYQDLIKSEGSTSRKAMEDLLAENSHLKEKVRWDKGPWKVPRWQTLTSAPDKPLTAFPPRKPPGKVLPNVDFGSGMVQMPTWFRRLTGGKVDPLAPGGVRGGIQGWHPFGLERWRADPTSPGGAYPKGTNVPSLPPPRGYKGSPIPTMVPVTGPEMIPGRLAGKAVPATQIADQLAKLHADVPPIKERLARWAPQAGKRVAWRGGGGILGMLLGSLAANYGGDQIRDALRRQNIASGIPMRQFEEATGRFQENDFTNPAINPANWFR